MSALYWAMFALAWLVAGIPLIAMLHYRRQLTASTTPLQQRLSDDAPLAAWCRQMRLTVITHTGWEFSQTLAEICRSEACDVREWNLPIQVVLQNDLEANGVPLLEAAPLRTGES